MRRRKPPIIRQRGWRTMRRRRRSSSGILAGSFILCISWSFCGRTGKCCCGRASSSCAGRVRKAIALEQILVYFIATYFCGAVYDGRVWGKARMAAVSAFLVGELWKARWLKNEATLDISDMTEILYRYSRELEHSDLNLERMERIMERRGIPWMEKGEER